MVAVIIGASWFCSSSLYSWHVGGIYLFVFIANMTDHNSRIVGLKQDIQQFKSEFILLLLTLKN